MKISKFFYLSILPFVVLLCANTNGFAQKAAGSEVKIKTEFHCNGGKTTIEREVGKEVGVIAVVADLETKIVTITYDQAKQNQEKLVAAIEKTGHRTEFSKADAAIKSSCGSHGVGEKNCETPKK